MSGRVSDQIAAWRTELEDNGEAEVRQNLLNPAIYNSEPKRIFVAQWLREKERARRAQERQAYAYTRWTFWAAVVAAIVSVIGIVVTLVH
jgi:hypothetical protein